jgi:hypothetical protein
MQLPQFKNYQFTYAPVNNKLGFRKGDRVVFFSNLENIHRSGEVIDVTRDNDYPVICQMQYGDKHILMRFSRIGEYRIGNGVQLMRLFKVGDKVMYSEGGGDKYVFGDIIRVYNTKKIAIIRHDNGGEDRTFFEDGTQSHEPESAQRRLHLVSPAPENP